MEAAMWILLCVLLTALSNEIIKLTLQSSSMHWNITRYYRCLWMTLVKFPTMTPVSQMRQAGNGTLHLITEDSTMLSSVSETTVWRAMASRVANCFFLRLFKLWDGDHSWEAKTGTPTSAQFTSVKTIFPEQLGVLATARYPLLLLHMNSQFVLRFYLLIERLNECILISA